MRGDNGLFRIGNRGGMLLVVSLALLPVSGCAVHTAPPASTLERTPLSRWDASVVSDQSYDPRWWRQFDDPVLESLESAAIDANRDVRSALARFDQARAVFDEDRRRRYPTVTGGAFVDVRDQAVPGLSDAAIRTNT
jgi:multidrug efflux system outer membrane protein